MSAQRQKPDRKANVDPKTVRGFGEEWSSFTQAQMHDAERLELFNGYFSLIDWTRRPKNAMDFGCGSGRWSVMVAPRVEWLVAVDASADALKVARENVQAANVTFVQATPDTLPFPDSQFDLIFSLGVLHHIPDTEGAVRSLTRKLCPGGALLLYLYCAFDRPWWYFRKIQDLLRLAIARLPFKLRYGISQLIAVIIYFPLARGSGVLESLGFDVSGVPLSFYRNRSFYTMRTDALDRFGTRLEQTFTASEIEQMMHAAGLERITFSDKPPLWCAVGYRPI
jgi:ubiquinone/menaquinone biosynthesis C-methylase UbiE